jgi:hypothetical protein
MREFEIERGQLDALWSYVGHKEQDDEQESEEACLHLERGEHSSHEAKGVQYAEGACRLVAAELEELADTLRAAAAEDGDGDSAPEKSGEEA